MACKDGFCQEGDGDCDVSKLHFFSLVLTLRDCLVSFQDRHPKIFFSLRFSTLLQVSGMSLKLSKDSQWYELCHGNITLRGTTA